jgi:hypothetical protein
MTAETQVEYAGLLARRGGPGDRARARSLAGLAELTAQPRGLRGLLRRAGAITAR